MAERTPIESFAVLTLVVFFAPFGSIARRCDLQINTCAWNHCMECSVNTLYRCPNGYRTDTNGEGVQRCSYLVNFGANFGPVAVPGCQHLCSRTITRQECCDGFWGQDCRGIQQLKKIMPSFLFLKFKAFCTNPGYMLKPLSRSYK